MREKLKLFLTYIEFFHKLHTKYLQRFSNKIQLMNTHINDDIKFDKTKKRDNLYDKVKIPLISAILVILIKDLNVKECIDSIQIISFIPKIPNPSHFCLVYKTTAAAVVKNDNPKIPKNLVHCKSGKSQT